MHCDLSQCVIADQAAPTVPVPVPVPKARGGYLALGSAAVVLDIASFAVPSQLAAVFLPVT
jgi:hypothetical protein